MLLARKEQFINNTMDLVVTGLSGMAFSYKRSKTPVVMYYAVCPLEVTDPVKSTCLGNQPQFCVPGVNYSVNWTVE